MTRHPWGEKIAISIIKVTRHEFEGGREVHWQEFWRDLDKIEGDGTPACTGRAKAAAYDARSYLL